MFKQRVAYLLTSAVTPWRNESRVMTLADQESFYKRHPQVTHCEDVVEDLAHYFM